MSSKNDIFNTVLFRKIGTAHTDALRWCDDSVASAENPEGTVTAIALSDGAGSCKNSRLGSQEATLAAVALLSDKFDFVYSLDDEVASEYILKTVQRALAKAAKGKGISDFLSLSATLICTAVSYDGRYILYHVGDGAAVGYSPENGCEVLSTYDHPGPANQTSFVTERFPTCNYKKGKGDYTSILLMSDGPENFLINGKTVRDYVRFIQELSHDLEFDEILPGLEALCELLRKNGMTDDCSFALITDTRALSLLENHCMPEALETILGSKGISDSAKSVGINFCTSLQREIKSNKNSNVKQ